jgi:hypothetical protein
MQVVAATVSALVERGNKPLGLLSMSRIYIRERERILELSFLQTLDIEDHDGTNGIGWRSLLST